MLIYQRVDDERGVRRIRCQGYGMRFKDMPEKG